MKTDSLIIQDKVYTVSELTKLIRFDLESSFPFVWVEGEISNLRQPSSGHYYFTLKDDQAQEDVQLKAVLFKSNASRIQTENKKNSLLPKFELKNGMKVVCGGRITVYEPRGEYQLVVEKLEPRGKGALQLAFEQLKEKTALVDWNAGKRKERYMLFSKSGFTEGMVEKAKAEKIDLINLKTMRSF